LYKLEAKFVPATLIPNQGIVSSPNYTFHIEDLALKAV